MATTSRWAPSARPRLSAATCGERNDLYAAGMTSQASVNVMLALEEEFDMEFPESMLNKGTFESVTAIRTALAGLTAS